jgi:hypothetical protein
VPQLSTTRASAVADPDDGPVVAGRPAPPSEWRVFRPEGQRFKPRDGDCRQNA